MKYIKDYRDRRLNSLLNRGRSPPASEANTMAGASHPEYSPYFKGQGSLNKPPADYVDLTNSPEPEEKPAFLPYVPPLGGFSYSSQIPGPQALIHPSYTAYSGNSTVMDESFARDVQALLDAGQDIEGTKDQNIPSSHSIDTPAWLPTCLNSSGNTSSSPFALQDENKNADTRRLAHDSGVDLEMASDALYAQKLQEELDREGEKDTFMHDRPAFGQSLRVPGEGNLEEDEDIDSKQEVVALKGFGDRVLKAKCGSCQKFLIYKDTDVMKLGKKWLTGQIQIDSTLECGKCSKLTCVGCGAVRSAYNTTPSLLSRRSNRTSKAPNPPVIGPPVWCCDEGRLFLIWTLLCTADNQKACNERRESYFTRSRAKSDPPRPSRGIGLRSNGVGYGDSGGHGGPLSLAGRKSKAFQGAKASKDTSDELNEPAFRHLTLLLPRWENGFRLDCEPPVILLAMINRSPILEKAAELLRNDSLEDIINRKKLYHSLVEFTQTLANHDATAAAVLGPRTVYPLDSGLLAVSFSDGRKYELRGQKKPKAEAAQSLAAVVTNLQVPSRKMLQQSKAHEADFQSEEGQAMLVLCRRICELSDFLQANSVPIETQSYTGKGKAPVQKPDESMAQWHRQRCVEEVDDDIFRQSYYYSRAITDNQAAPKMGRIKHLLMELATLQTSLPDGIYVRHGSSRPDMMKVMIVGPKNTPYEGGLFEFDLFCPMNYPHEAPKMQFKTTGGGAAHFNPNLYADGKVCLSLLGTWAGQPWIAGQSTLLQVFVSIQSMIFCDEPWYNEPGREHQPNNAASRDYNIQIQALTIPHALINWLRFKHVIWQDVIDKHFSVFGTQISAVLKQWNDKALATQRQFSVPSFPGGHSPYFFGPGAGTVPRLAALVQDFENALRAPKDGKRKQPEPPMEERVSRHALLIGESTPY